jgi:hypothetical protein
VRRFSIEPWMASRKIQTQPDMRRELLSGKWPFLLVTFLWAPAKKSDPAAQRAEALHSRNGQSLCEKPKPPTIRLPP